MLRVEFNSSAGQSIGVEVEYGIVSRDTGELIPVSSEILDELTGGTEHPKAKNELFQPSLEVITGICSTPAEAMADLASTVAEIQPLLRKRDLGLVSTGTHPFSHWDGVPVTPNPRYLQLIDTMQWPAQRLLIHGIHVHVGIRSPEKAIITTNVAAMYLPIFLALSASSPYWLGRDTGLASARTKIFEGLPTTGIPPQLSGWNAFNDLLDTLVHAGTIETVREVWWDIRPHPDFGTVEFRMCDGMTDLREVATVAALAQCLVAWIDDWVDNERPIKLLPEWMLRDNKWRACRKGIDAHLIIDEKGTTQPLVERLESLIELLMPYAIELGCTEELLRAGQIVQRGPSYIRQRQLVADGKTLPEVVNELVEETDEGVAAYLTQEEA